MKFLFSQYQLFIPEEFGRVVFDVEKREVEQDVFLNTEKSDLATEAVTSSIKKEKKALKKESVKKGLEDAEREGELIIQKAVLDVRKDLSEAEAKKLSTAAYLEKIPDWGKKMLDDPNFQNWQTKYARILPNGWEDNLKIGGVVGVVSFGNTKGGMLDKTKNALKWGSVVAAVAHPAITRGLAIAMEKIGSVAAPALGIAFPNLIFELINNPRRVFAALKGTKSENILESPIGELLLHGNSSSDTLTKAIQTGQQQPSVLRANGLLRLGNNTELNTILDEMEAYDSGVSTTAFSAQGNGVQKAATFIAQMSVHELSDDKLQELRSKLWNEKGNASDVRAVLAHNSVGEVFRFFESKKQSNPDLWNRFNAELKKTKELQIQPITKEGLKELFIDPTVAAGMEGFEMKDSKHGIRQLLSGGIGRAALSLYAISYFLVYGLMKIKGVAQGETYTTKPKEKVKKVATWGSEKWKAFKDLFKKTPLVAIAGIASSKENEWVKDDKDLKAIKALSGKDKRIVVKNFRKWRIEKDDTYKKRVKEETKDLKGKDKRNEEEKIKQQVEMTQDKFKSMFDGISSGAKDKLTFLKQEK